MPEVRGPGNEQEKKERRHFIQEKIVKRPPGRRQIAYKLFKLAGGAAIFGAVAAVSFSAVLPLTDRFFKEETVREPVSIPKDEITEPTTVPVETTAPAAAETTECEEPIEDKIQSVMENYNYTAEDFGSMLNSLRTRVQTADKGIVAVHAVQENVDWFDNPLLTTGSYAGAVVARTEQELLILTPEAAVEQADAIRVTFSDGSDVAGQVKQKDSVADMAVVSVSVSVLPETTRNTVQTVALGNSYIVREGDVLIAVGGPAGSVHSMDYGVVSYVLRTARMADQNCRILYSDILSDTETGTFFLNISGELVGWAMEPQEDQSGDEREFAEIMGISDYKGILEKLSNGQGAPYLGIVGQTVTETMAFSGQPSGVYVVNAVAESPAYAAGIQNGDIITAVNGKTVTSMRDFQNAVEQLACGQEIVVLAARSGREHFTELEFSVTVGTR